ncbi:MAG: hypothetical protein WAU78_10485 [Roseiarcus sp.]
MAYSSTYGLSRVAFLGYYGDAGTPGTPTTQKSLWGYVTADAAATVENGGYFPATLYTQLSLGDVIMAVMACNGTPVIKNYVVTASGSGGITVALQTASAG